MMDSEFRKSRYFKRGWILQELIAPPDLVFFSSQWRPICRRDEISSTIQNITNIPATVLKTGWNRNKTRGEHSSIAHIMGWASNRETTRVEDMAYSLLGLFDINMPLLYGEGHKAFLRLQLEIIQRTTDVSFLSWQPLSSFGRIENPNWTTFLPALALKPSYFSGAQTPNHNKAVSYGSPSLRMSNLGLSLRVPLVETLDLGLVFAVLIPFSETGRAVWMPLLKTEDGRYVRLGFISTALVVPHCHFDLPVTDIAIPIYGLDGTDTIDLSPLRQPQRINILLTFPWGRQGFCFPEMFSVEHGSQSNKSCLRWRNILLGLFVPEDGSDIAYGAMEFLPWPASPSLPGSRGIGAELKSQTVALAFMVRLGKTGKPLSWTCSQLPQETTTRTEYSLEKRTIDRLRHLQNSVSSDWKQDCTLYAPGLFSGRVAMDLLERDLQTPEFGGYRDESNLVHLDVDGKVDRGYFPILAQIGLPFAERQNAASFQR